MTAGSQRSEPFDEPPRSEIPGISRSHIEAMESSDADEVWVLVNMHHVVLHTIGRKSGKEHKVALPFWRDADGHRIVVASFSGAPQHPAWYLNVTDKEANPEVRTRVQGGMFWADVQELEGEDYARTWDALVVDRPHYLDYQTRCERRLPLIRLVEKRPA